MANEFGKLARQMKQAITTGAVRAVNKSLTDIKTKMINTLSDQTSLTKSAIKDRTNQINAKVSNPRGVVSVAFTKAISLAEFKPRQKAVYAPGIPKPGKRRVPRRKFYGVTINIGGFNSVLVPGGFLRTVASGKQLVFGRNNSVDADNNYTNVKGGKDDIRSLTTTILNDVAAVNANSFVEQAQASYDSTVDSEIDFAVAQATNGANITDV